MYLLGKRPLPLAMGPKILPAPTLTEPRRVGAKAVTEARLAEADPPWEGLHGPELFEACLLAIRSGNRRAMNRLVSELTPLVWNVARGQGLDQHTAEDVVQSVWLTLFSHLDQVREPRALAGWLVTTTRHEAQRVNGRKPQPVPLTEELAEAMPSTQRGPEAEVLRSERDRRIWRAFGKLPRRCQEILRLTVLAGRAEYRAVADTLRIPRGSIGPNRGRCLKAMRELLEIEGGSA